MNKYQVDKYQDFKENFFALKAALIYLKNAQEAHRKIRKEAIESTTKKLFPGYDEERFTALCNKKKSEMGSDEAAFYEESGFDRGRVSALFSIHAPESDILIEYQKVQEDAAWRLRRKLQEVASYSSDFWKGEPWEDEVKELIQKINGGNKNV